MAVMTALFYQHLCHQIGVFTMMLDINNPGSSPAILYHYTLAFRRYVLSMDSVPNMKQSPVQLNVARSLMK